MYANAAQVLDHLEDEVERKVAKNTKLIRVGDRLACLRFHSTVVAWYGERGVMLTTDWHTATTWRRIAEFTPARPHRQDFLRFVVQPNDDRVLYEPGLIVDANGLVKNPMMPSRQRKIETCAHQMVLDIRAYARTAVEAWESFTEDRCECQEGDWWNGQEEEQLLDHLTEHAARREPILPYMWRKNATYHSENKHGVAVTEPIRKEFSAWMVTDLIPHVIETANPTFKFHYQRKDVR